MENWADGKLHGVFAISQDTRAVIQAANGNSFVSPSGWLIAAITLGAVLSVLLSTYLMRSAISALTQTAKELLSVSDQLHRSSEDVSHSSQDLSSSTTEQAASLQQTAASLEQITAMIVKASDSASLAAKNAAESKEKADQGQSSVEQMITSMDEIRESNRAIIAQVDEGNAQMGNVVKVIQDIGNKTKIINEIVFQTKLLSFNASVEAARAGEHGKGFAVVAEEVGKLAQMSGDAAKEITELLDSSVSIVEGIVEQSKGRINHLAKDGEVKIENGVRVARLCSESLAEIVSNVSTVSGLSQDISHASVEQSQGVAEINKAMTRLETVTQRNANSSEGSARAASVLSQQSEALNDSLKRLLRVVNGSAPADESDAA